MDSDENHSSDEESDQEYCPDEKEVADLSEEDSDGEIEEADTEGVSTNGIKGRKRRAKGSKKSSERKSKTQKIENKESESETEVLNEEEEKKKADALWADFLGDVEEKKPASSKVKTETVEKNVTKNLNKLPEVSKKVTVTEIFDFAGEKVEVTKEVDVTSKEAKILPTPSTATTTQNGIHTSKNNPSSTGLSRLGFPVRQKVGGGGGGLNAVLGAIGKNKKISTLEKTKLDWDGFKKVEGIEEEIQTFNKGKDGYLERQDFLERTDLKQFDIEKSLRQSKRSNR